ncbi:MAG: hypothetical protein GMKNLPBB_01805 [Myxococcota bacterium]|nr:hypothetical protein [Myxococcota bacterium]
MRNWMKLLVAVLALSAVAAPVELLAQKKPPAKKAAPAKGKKEDAPKADDKKASKDVKKPAKEEEKEDARTGPASFDFKPGTDTAGTGKDAEADRKRDEAIKLMQEIIKSTPDSQKEQKANLFFQLAELYWQKVSYLRLDDMDKFNQAQKACFDANKANPEKCDKMKPDLRRSQVYEKQALSVYEQIVAKYGDYPRVDEVYYILGHNYYESAGNNEALKKKSIQYYYELTKKFPNSKWTSHAYLGLGEYFFEANDLNKSITAYTKCYELQNPETRTFCLYKLAWCDFNLGEYDRSLEKFKQVVTLSQTESDKERIRLKAEALRDMVQSFAAVEAVDVAKEYYESVCDKKDTHKYISALASTYSAQDRAELAVRTYELLLGMDLDHPNAPAYQAEIVDAYSKLENRAEVIKQTRRLVANYMPGSAWHTSNQSNKAAVERARGLAEEKLRFLAKFYLQEAQKTRDYKTFALSRDILEEYLKAFPDGEEAYYMAYLYAEILYTLGEFDKGAVAYVNVTKMTPPKGLEDYKKKSSYAAVLCYEKLADNNCENPKEALKRAQDAKKGSLKIPEDKEKLKRFEFKPGKIEENLEERSFNDCTQKLLEANDVYISLVNDKDPNYLPVKYKSAFLYFQHNKFSEAARRLGEIIEKYPKDPLAKRSVLLILDTFEVKKNWKELYTYAVQFRNNKGLAEPKFHSDLDEIIERSAFNIITDDYAAAKKVKDSDRKKGEALLTKAADDFRDYTEKYKKSKFIDGALFNAMVIYSEGNKLDFAVALGEQFIKRHEKNFAPKPGAKAAKAPAAPPPPPKKGKEDPSKPFDIPKMYETAVWSMAKAWEKMADFAKSADWYERYMAEFPASKSYEDALFNAALFRDRLGDQKKALDLYEQFLAKYPKAKDAPNIKYQIALVHYRAKDWAKAKKTFQDYKKEFAGRTPKGTNLESDYYIMECDRNLKNQKDADKALKTLALSLTEASDPEMTPFNHYVVAEARFKLMDEEWQKFKKLRISAGKNVAKELEEKATTLQRLEADYLKILEFKQPDWGLAALFMIGMLYEEFAESLFKAPIPANLNIEQREMYIQLLTEKALPLQEKAIQAYEVVLKKASELAVYNQWTIEAQNHLRKLQNRAFRDPPSHDFKFSEGDYISPNPIKPEGDGAAPAEGSTGEGSSSDGEKKPESEGGAGESSGESDGDSASN